MVNGYPSGTPLVKDYLISDDLITSVDSNTPHHVDFSYPVFVKGSTQYCWVVGGTSPAVRHYAARLGQPLIDNPNKIVETQPSPESSFRSQNGTTWNAEQFEDLKYNLYTAKFNTSEATWTFELEDSPDLLPPNAIQFTAASNTVRVHIPDNASKVGDKLTLKLFEGYQISLDGATAPKPNTDVTTPTGSFHINSVAATDVATIFTAYVSNVVGFVATGDSVTVDGETFILSTGFPSMIFGVPTSELNKEHTVTAIKSKAFVDLTVTTPATETGTYEEIIEVTFNRAYNIVNVSSDLIDHDVPISLSMSGVSSNLYNDSYLAADYAVVNDIDLTMNYDVHLPHPMKFVSAPNTTSAARKTKVKIKTKVKDGVSPVMNMNTLSAVFVGNKLSHESVETLGVDYIPETNAKGGSQLFKYVTMPVVLKNPAYEVNIFLEVYCGPTNDYDIYFRSAPAHEQALIKDKEWILVPHEKIKSTTPSSKVELELSLRDLITGWDDGEEMVVIQTKIVGMGTNSSSPPLFSNLRIIAST
jgi:hypothetical protein